MVVAMSDAYNDPSGNTAQFKAFVSEPEPEPGSSSRMGLVVAGVVLAAIVVAVLAWAVV